MQAIARFIKQGYKLLEKIPSSYKNLVTAVHEQTKELARIGDRLTGAANKAAHITEKHPVFKKGDRVKISPHLFKKPPQTKKEANWIENLKKYKDVEGIVERVFPDHLTVHFQYPSNIIGFAASDSVPTETKNNAKQEIDKDGIADYAIRYFMANIWTDDIMALKALGMAKKAKTNNQIELEIRYQDDKGKLIKYVLDYLLKDFDDQETQMLANMQEHGVNSKQSLIKAIKSIVKDKAK